MKHQFSGVSLGSIQDPEDEKDKAQLLACDQDRKLGYQLRGFDCIPRGARVLITVETVEGTP